jgi:DNA (cytosine-5)-methyltransferase 1
MDLLAGIGGTLISLEEAGGRVVFSTEADGYTCPAYEANFGENPQGVITEFLSRYRPTHDVLVADSSCQR